MSFLVKDSKGREYFVHDLFAVTRVRVSWDNGKTMIPGWGLLAGDKCSQYSGAVPRQLREHMTGTTGTCSGDCPGCYAKVTTRNIAPMIKYWLNTCEAKADPVRFVALIERELFGSPVVDYKVIRLHDSGEFFSMDYLRAVLDMVRRHPGTTFYTYSKENDLFLQYGLDNLPENFVLSCSPWPGVCEPLADLPQFIYDDGSRPELASLPHCPAVNADGHRTGITCAQCLHCARAKKGDRWAVYAH